MNVAVIGAGSWGTALAQVAALNGHDVVLWARRPEVASYVNLEHRNPDYLKDARLDSRVRATSSIAEAIEGALAVVSVTPSKYVRSTADLLAPVVSHDLPIVVCSKGVGRALGPQSRRGNRQGRGGGHGGGQRVEGDRRVFPETARFRDVQGLHERRRHGRGVVRGVQERHCHRRRRRIRPWLRRQHGRHADDPRASRDEPSRGCGRR